MKYLILIGEMAKRSITIEAVSKLLGLHRNTISNKLNGKTPFSIDEAIEIKDAFFSDWKMEELFRREE